MYQKNGRRWQNLWSIMVDQKSTFLPPMVDAPPSYSKLFFDNLNLPKSHFRLVQRLFKFIATIHGGKSGDKRGFSAWLRLLTQKWCHWSCFSHDQGACWFLKALIEVEDGGTATSWRENHQLWRRWSVLAWSTARSETRREGVCFNREKRVAASGG